MKTNKIFGVVLMLLMALCLAFAISCNGKDTDTDTSSNTDSSTNTDTDTGVTPMPEPEGHKLTLSTDVNFKITVLDHNDSPISNAVVRFTKLNGDSTMDMTSKNGEVTKNLTRGDIYITVENSTTKTSYYLVKKDYNEQGAIFNAYMELTSSNVHDSGTPDDTSDDRTAYVTREAGKFYANGLSSDKPVFFLFVPSEDGIYEFKMNVAGQVGYYGAPINAIQKPIEPFAKDGVITLEIKKKNLGEDFGSTTPYLIGITSSEATDCLFEIERTGDPVYTIDDEPYYQVTNPGTPKTETLDYKNWVVNATNIDISKAVTVVKGSDGYYHLDTEDGAIIFVRVGSESKYLPSLYKVCETSLMRAYIYDADGNFIRKEMYNGLINQYYGYADAKTGLIPLDDYMVNAIKNHGNDAGWWEKGAMNYLFGEDEINVESAWLFACCTIEIDKSAGADSDNRIKVEKSLPDAIETQKVQFVAGENDTLYFEITSPVDSKLKVNTKGESIKVVYGGEEYTANANGVIEISIVKATALTFEIVNASSLEETFEITFTIS